MFLQFSRKSERTCKPNDGSGMIGIKIEDPNTESHCVAHFKTLGKTFLLLFWGRS